MFSDHIFIIFVFLHIVEKKTKKWLFNFFYFGENNRWFFQIFIIWWKSQRSFFKSFYVAFYPPPPIWARFLKNRKIRGKFFFLKKIIFLRKKNFPRILRFFKKRAHMGGGGKTRHKNFKKKCRPLTFSSYISLPNQNMTYKNILKKHYGLWVYFDLQTSYHGDLQTSYHGNPKYENFRPLRTPVFLGLKIGSLAQFVRWFLRYWKTKEWFQKEKKRPSPLN